MNGKIHDEVLKRKNAITNEKTSPGSFIGTVLESWLEKIIKKVVICGYMTQMCCDTTARQGHAFGFQCRILERCHWNNWMYQTSSEIKAEELHKTILITHAKKAGLCPQK